MRGLNKEQKFWAAGQTLTANFHLSPKNGIYVFFNYHINGKFQNDVTATAKSPVTTPQFIPYKNKAKLILTHLSTGWKRYIFGYFDRETKGNLYGYGGLGLMMGKVENTSTIQPDTANYTYPIETGRGRFKRLTMDVGLGYELPIGGDYYVFVDCRSHIPITDYPTPYLLVNGYSPVNISAFFGLRMLFN